MPDDSLVEPLGAALAALIRYVDLRPADATADDDVRALEDVAFALQQVGPDDRKRLRQLLGTDLSGAIGIDM
jgi:hypothetical protein